MHAQKQQKEQTEERTRERERRRGNDGTELFSTEATSLPLSETSPTRFILSSPSDSFSDNLLLAPPSSRLLPSLPPILCRSSGPSSGSTLVWSLYEPVARVRCPAHFARAHLALVSRPVLFRVACSTSPLPPPQPVLSLSLYSLGRYVECANKSCRNARRLWDTRSPINYSAGAVDLPSPFSQAFPSFFFSLYPPALSAIRLACSLARSYVWPRGQPARFRREIYIANLFIHLLRACVYSCPTGRPNNGRGTSGDDANHMRRSRSAIRRGDVRFD